jgi:hypothetical protein
MRTFAYLAGLALACTLATACRSTFRDDDHDRMRHDGRYDRDMRNDMRTDTRGGTYDNRDQNWYGDRNRTDDWNRDQTDRRNDTWR